MKRLTYIAAAAIIIAADQFTKYLVRSGMKPGERIPILGDFFSLRYVQNTGAAFSMFEGSKFVTFFLTSVLIIACIIYAVLQIKAGRRMIPFLLCCIASGGISNMIDRVVLGFVTDMISCGRFAVFNVADMFITCGCVLLMISVLIMYRRGEEL